MDPLLHFVNFHSQFSTLEPEQYGQYFSDGISIHGPYTLSNALIFFLLLQFDSTSASVQVIIDVKHHGAITT